MKYFNLLHSTGEIGEKLNSLDFVKEMLLIIKSKSIDWKDVKYNYLDYSNEYSQNKEEIVLASRPKEYPVGPVVLVSTTKSSIIQ